MAWYRKKPVTIEAVQFDGLNPTEIKDFVGENCEVEIYDNGVTPPVAHIVIHTLEGDMEVSKGDYVIKGVKGEFYPCKPDIFRQTYESEEPDKSLEEEIEKCWKDWLSPSNQPSVEGVFPKSEFMMYARHFAEWQKSQMLKDAYVESLIVEDGRIELGGNPLPCLNPIILLPYPQFKPGDKVRIIIIKED